MALAPSAATGATGLQRLLLIFLMKLDESQSAMNNTSFSDDRFSDQSVRTSRKLRKKPQEREKPPQKPATPPETTASLTESKTSQRTQISPNKSRASSRKLHLTEQKPKRTVENAKSPNKI